MNETSIKQLHFDEKKDQPICGNEFVQVTENIRIYYKRVIYDNNAEDKTGFDFYVFEETSYSGDYDKPLDDPDVCGECMFKGVAYWDGMRHFYMGSEFTDNYGYLYYPNLDKIIKVLNALKALEEKYCREYDLLRLMD